MAVTLPTEVSLRTQMFSGGDFVDAVSGRTYAVENPANGQTIAEVAEGGIEDVDRAVEAARRAAPGWAATPPADRKKVLQRFADLIDANGEELARIETLDVGKPISDTRSLDIPDSAATIRWHAEATDKLYDQSSPRPGRARSRWSSASRSASSARSCRGTTRSDGRLEARARFSPPATRS
jgi:gamma-glutamyl-gamma-aminobutyraldehyde dehydrogenase